MEYAEGILEIIIFFAKNILTKQFLSVKTGTKYTLDVVHKSENYIIVNKGYDILINSNNPDEKLTLEHLLYSEYPNLANPKLRHNFYFTHRLDYASSGLICIALNKKACGAATACFERRKANKYYIALLRGHVAVNECFDIKEPIGEDKSEINSSHRMCISGNECCISPREAHTRLLVIERGVYGSYPATKVLLKPVTGRRHQLRVHCSSLGHTIIGDYTYSNRKDITPFRTFLHAFRWIIT
ncbi:RNA pseudouridylate synthase domain-containing protein 1-like isoform X2 [Lycorma delicatula]|uniref:RNA pseudouridylate synthase domain-containing protein 1-like isoform X2 n=1 Tax=Lycorma delicatula TaxID=130591 RepID=UPI003F510221